MQWVNPEFRAMPILLARGESIGNSIIPAWLVLSATLHAVRIVQGLTEIC